MHQSSFDKMQSFRNRYLTGKEANPLVILDLGSRNIGGCYRTLFDSPNWQYRGLDLEPGDNVDVVIQEPYFWREIPSASADVFISGQTFEHIEFFWVTMREIARVLKPGGLCCIIAPSGGYEHRYPVDCWRFYPDGLAALARYAELEILETKTQWDEQGYTDGSNDWKDSVLIARKPIVPQRKPSESPRSQFTSTAAPTSSFKDYPLLQVTEKELPDNNPLKKQLELVGYQKQVVDFGCATGYFAQLLKPRHCQVVGVELNPEAAKLAELHCESVLVANLDTVSIGELFAGQQFDVAVFGDVLEHLSDPWRVLREVRQILKPDGCIVASIPNIAHGAIRLALLQGQFVYSERGILDNSHLRFFTRKTVEDLFEQSGYLIEALDRTKLPVFTDNLSVPQLDRRDFSLETLQRVEADPEAETLQFIIKAVPCSIEKKYAMLSEQFQQMEDKLEWSYAQFHQTQAQLEQSQAQLQDTQTQFERSKQALITAQAIIAAMETSKFWKLRKAWFAIKRKFGF